MTPTTDPTSDPESREASTRLGISSPHNNWEVSCTSLYDLNKGQQHFYRQTWLNRNNAFGDGLNFFKGCKSQASNYKVQIKLLFLFKLRGLCVGSFEVCKWMGDPNQSYWHHVVDFTLNWPDAFWGMRQRLRLAGNHVLRFWHPLEQFTVAPIGSQWCSHEWQTCCKHRKHNWLILIVY